MITRRQRVLEKVAVPIAPMIDCVFLLLIYFMVTSTLDREELELGFMLPGLIEQTEPLHFPDEVVITIADDGQFTVNDFPYDEPGAVRLVELETMLGRFAAASKANKTEAQVTVAPADGVTQQVILRVMDACDKAKIDAVHFAIPESPAIFTP